jgi:tetratricopeptide (TPR) repeat protein
MRKAKLGGFAALAEAVVAEAEAFGGDPREAIEHADVLLRRDTQNEPLLRRGRGVALARLGRIEEATTELQAALTAARAVDAKYDVAATLEVLEELGELRDAGVQERATILTQLGIERLPRPFIDAATDGAAGAQGASVMRLRDAPGAAGESSLVR